MAGRLTGRQRRAAWLLAAILLAVIAGHALLGHELQALRESWSAEAPAPMPERLQVAFVREMKQSAPAAAAPAVQRVQPRPAKKPAAQSPAPAVAPAVAASAAASEPGAEPAAEPPPDATVAEPATPAPSEPTTSLAEAADAAASPVPASVAAASAAEPSDPVEPGEPGPEWPASVQLNYRLQGNYRGEVHGQGQVQWIREGRRYQVHLDVTLGPSFAPLIARRMSSDGLLTSQGIAPQRYDEDTRVLFSSRRRVSVLFAPRADGGTEVQLGDGSKRQAAAGVQDSASQFVQLTWLFLTGREALQPGRIVEMPLALPRKLYAWRYQVIGEETLETPMGTLATWHLQPLLEPGDKLGKDLKAEVWLAPTLQYLPVRLRIAQDESTFIDLMLNAAPLMTAP